MKAVAVLVVFVICANGVNPQSPYACWGGCYNKCFLGAAMAQSERLACGYLCLDTCIPRTATAADYKYYCHLGCYLKRCIPVSFGTFSLLSLSLSV